MHAILICLLITAAALAAEPLPISITKDFEGGSIGKVEKLGEAQFRLHVEGQADERGRNRQASWYYFRMENVANRDLVLTLTDFVGEYNDKPGACPMNAETIPVFSTDGKTWQHFPAMEWDDVAKEATLKIRTESKTLWIAHIPPYTHTDLLRLLEDVKQSPHARLESIGKTVQGRDLHLVTVTDFNTPDEAKKVVWLQARQHPWEAGTSQVMEGALRFITSDDGQARELRQAVLFKFMPMGHPDGCVNGWVRFNANGYDVNRHWDKANADDPEMLRLMPEVCHVKRALFAQMDSGKPIDLMINMHNTETAEYIDTRADTEPAQTLMRRLYKNLVDRSTFDPNRLTIMAKPGNSTTCLWREKGIPVALMEQRIAPGQKLGRRPTVEDRLIFGRQLITVMAETVLD